MSKRESETRDYSGRRTSQIDIYAAAGLVTSGRSASVPIIREDTESKVDINGFYRSNSILTEVGLAASAPGSHRGSVVSFSAGVGEIDGLSRQSSRLSAFEPEGGNENAEEELFAARVSGMVTRMPSMIKAANRESINNGSQNTLVFSDSLLLIDPNVAWDMVVASGKNNGNFSPWVGELQEASVDSITSVKIGQMLRLMVNNIDSATLGVARLHAKENPLEKLNLLSFTKKALIDSEQNLFNTLVYLQRVDLWDKFLQSLAEPSAHLTKDGLTTIKVLLTALKQFIDSENDTMNGSNRNIEIQGEYINLSNIPNVLIQLDEYIQNPSVYEASIVATSVELAIVAASDEEGTGCSCMGEEGCVII
ncbi:MAG: hypothetical protein COA94_06200 [Rickettsiales bacterium]|nr:MAG: hypothetical protein COA94_06200 [Rickettsiales bacterium]